MPERLKNICRDLVRAVLPARCPISGEIVEKQGLISPSVWSKLDFIAPPICVCCGIRFDIPLADETLCPACHTQPPPFDRVRSVFVYDDVSRDMILAFKHGDQTHLSAAFVPWLDRVGVDFATDAGIVVPVPLHPLRLLARRYNQAAILAQGLARVWRRPYVPDALRRVRQTESQGHKTEAQRHDNVAGAFRVTNPDRIVGQNIVLVDDVYTSGATVKVCTSVLKRAGAARVDVLTLARVMRDRRLD